MNKIIVMVALVFTFSCSNLSKNTIQQGELPIRNGVFQNQEWKEDLILNRYSWYHELTLQFEVLIGKIPEQSGFNFWLSKDELSEISKCQNFYLMLAYSHDTKNIPYSALNDQLDKSGFKKMELMEFKRNLWQHPDANMNSLRLYQVFGVCKKDNLKPFRISFPGFSEIEVK
jgi:hypothetical protein